MSLKHFTSPNLIIPCMKSANAGDAIMDLSRLLENEGRIADASEFKKAVLERESQASTEMSLGMAFPHARLPVEELILAFGIAERTLSWSSQNTSAVRMIFLMAIPESNTTQHLQVLSGVARMSKDVQLLKSLYSAHSTNEILDVFGKIPIRTYGMSKASSQRLTA